MTYNDLLCRIMAGLRSGPLAPETVAWFQGAAGELAEAEGAWLGRWLAAYDGSLTRQPEPLADYYRRESWLFSTPLELPHDLVVYAEIQIEQLEVEARRIMRDWRPPYFGFMDDDMDARARGLQVEAECWRHALSESIQESSQ